jgi:hypothetical protein
MYFKVKNTLKDNRYHNTIQTRTFYTSIKKHQQLV